MNHMKNTELQPFIGNGIILCPFVAITDGPKFLYIVVRNILIVYSIL